MTHHSQKSSYNNSSRCKPCRNCIVNETQQNIKIWCSEILRNFAQQLLTTELSQLLSGICTEKHTVQIRQRIGKKSIELWTTRIPPSALLPRHDLALFMILIIHVKSCFLASIEDCQGKDFWSRVMCPWNPLVPRSFWR